jgi:hypothetical protein
VEEDSIQNKFITVVAVIIAVVINILRNNKNAKYFSVIVDCIPDISQTEQVSLNIDMYQMELIWKSLWLQMNFLPVQSTTGQGLCNVLVKVKELEKL